MIQKISELVLEYWPALVASAGALVSGLITYCISRLKYKTKILEQQSSIAELKKAIIEGSYIVCPKCGESIYLKDIKIYTKGDTK